MYLGRLTTRTLCVYKSYWCVCVRVSFILHLQILKDDLDHLLIQLRDGKDNYAQRCYQEAWAKKYYEFEETEREMIDGARAQSPKRWHNVSS
jgi:hypothetical protein